MLVDIIFCLFLESFLLFAFLLIVSLFDCFPEWKFVYFAIVYADGHTANSARAASASAAVVALFGATDTADAEGVFMCLNRAVCIV